MSKRTLIRDIAAISMEPRLGDFAATDILFADKKNAAGRRVAVGVHFGLFS